MMTLQVFDGLPSRRRPHPPLLLSDVYRIPLRSTKDRGVINC